MEANRDAEGYLVNPEDWNETLALKLAAEENIQLDDNAWVVIHFLREYYNDHQTAADVRHVINHLVKTLGYDKKKAKQLIFSLFPHGYVKQACKIAGMKRPRAWSTG